MEHRGDSRTSRRYGSGLWVPLPHGTFAARDADSGVRPGLLDRRAPAPPPRRAPLAGADPVPTRRESRPSDFGAAERLEALWLAQRAWKRNRSPHGRAD